MKIVRKKSIFYSSTAILFSALSTTSVLAQSQPAEVQEASLPNAAADPAGHLGDIVVTARKRMELLRRVPVAATAFTGADLEQQGVRTPLDLGRQTPSLTVSQGSQTSSSALTFSIRGQTASDIILTFDQPVGIYIDGIDNPRPYGLLAQLVDVSRVEILKGPQGTLYGRNTTGGAVNIISRQPDYSGAHGNVGAEFTNYRGRRLTGAVNLPLIDNVLTTRVAFQSWTRDGYAKSRVTGDKVGGDKGETFLRGIVQFDPTDQLSVNFKADVTRIRETGLVATARNYTDNMTTNQQVAIELGLNPLLPSSIAAARARLNEIVGRGNADFFTTDAQTPLFDNVDQHSFGLTASYQLSDAITARFVGGYRKFTRDSQWDFDATPFKIVGYGVEGSGPRYFPHFPLTQDTLYTSELNLSGTSFNDRFKWLVGAFYSHEKGNEASTNEVRPDFSRVLANYPFTVNIAQATGVFNKSYSAFTQNSFNFTDSLSITGGARITHDKRGLTQSNRRFDPFSANYQCLTANPPVVLQDPSTCQLSRSTSVSRWSWLGSINYEFSSDIFGYFKASKSFRAGGYDLRLIAPAFAPETAQDYELGLKASLFGGRLRGNFAAYRTDYRNKQERANVVVNNNNVTVTTNAANSIIKGFEGEVNVIPARGLTVRGTVGYINGRYKTFPAALNYINQVVGASGEKFSNPPWTYSLSGRYEAPLSNGKVAVQADWSYTSRPDVPARLTDPAVPAGLFRELFESDIGLLNGRIEYSLERSGLTMALFATNLLNKHYQIGGLGQVNVGGIQVGQTQEPRIWGLQFRKTFGNE